MNTRIALVLPACCALLLLAPMRADELQIALPPLQDRFPMPDSWLPGTTWRHESGKYTLRFTDQQVVTSYESYARKWVAIDVDQVILYPEPGRESHLSLLVLDPAAKTFRSYVLKVAEGQEHVRWQMVEKPANGPDK